MLAHGIEAIRKHLAGLPGMDDVDIPVLRKIYDAAERAFDLPQGITVSAVECGGRPGEAGNARCSICMAAAMSWARLNPIAI